MLIGARFVQGVGGALSSAVVLGMIVKMFPEPRDMAKAIGVYGFVASAGGSIGLLAGGVLTEAINWHWIFFINVPVGIATAILARRLVVDDEGHRRSRGAPTCPGAVVLTAGLMLGVYNILEVGKQGWGSTQTLVLGAISLALVAAFVVRQARIPNPLMPLRLFRSRNVAAANLVMALLVAGMFAMFFLGALYMQRILGYDPLEVGLAFLPSTIVMGTISLRYTERLNMRFGAKNDAAPRHRVDRRRAAAVRAHAGRRQLPDRRGAAGGLHRPRRRPRLPVAHVTLAMSGATPERLGPGLGPGERDRAGGRRDRAGGARHAGHRAHRRPARRRRVERRGAQLRLPPGLPDRARCWWRRRSWRP